MTMEDELKKAGVTHGKPVKPSEPQTLDDAPPQGPAPPPPPPPHPSEDDLGGG